MEYCLASLGPAPDGHGLSPDFPEGVSSLLLADLRHVRWGLYQYDSGDDWASQHRVDDWLAALIESGKRYPPALAFSRQRVQTTFENSTPSREKFAREYGGLVELRLAQQQESRFLLARARRDEIGYLTKGEWYWVTNVTVEPAIVSWVSDDYFFYNNPLEDFELSEAQCQFLRGGSVA